MDTAPTWRRHCPDLAETINTRAEGQEHPQPSVGIGDRSRLKRAAGFAAGTNDPLLVQLGQH